jgi:hypothetical protein
MDAFIQTEARRTRYTTTVTRSWCNGPDAAFGAEAAVLEAMMAAIRDHGGLPCDGGGVPGPWCNDCAWGDSRVEEEWDGDD